MTGDAPGARAGDVPGLAALLSDEGWAYASLPPQEPGDPGRFHALFGRDSLICALQVLPAAPDVARATLRALAARQGRVVDADTDEEPGKIPHEYRPEAGAWFVETGWPVRDGGLLYYGTADATSWFLIVLGALGDTALDAELEPSWRAAAAWLRGALDAGGGLVRHGPRRGTGGLAQQGWRDAIAPVARHPEGAGIVRPDGSEPAAPLADADCQAAAVAALDALQRLDPVATGPRARRRCERASPRRSSRPPLAAPAPGRWRSRATTRRYRAPARSSAGCSGRARSTRAPRQRPPNGSCSPTCSRRSVCARSPPSTPRSARAPTTAAPSGRSTAGSAGAASARPGSTRTPSASAPACWRRSIASAARRSCTRWRRDGALEPVPVANRVQAWTVGARWAFEHGWDGRVAGGSRALGEPGSVAGSGERQLPH